MRSRLFLSSLAASVLLAAGPAGAGVLTSATVFLLTVCAHRRD